MPPQGYYQRTLAAGMKARSRRDDKKETGDSDGYMRQTRQLIVISYHFGRDGATGGFRWYQMAQYLSENGWPIDVITAGRDAASDPAFDALPVTVHEVRPPRWAELVELSVNRLLAALARFRRRLPLRRPQTRTSADTPVAEVWDPQERRRGLSRFSSSVLSAGRLLREYAWGTAAARRAAEIASTGNPYAIVVSAPPHMTHLAALRLARKAGVPLVADFRDPWIAGLGGLVHFPTDLERIVGSRCEPKVHAGASLVVFNTDSMARAVAGAMGERRAQRTAVVCNGYDDGENVGLPSRERFIVALTGHLYPYMDPRPLLAACAALRARFPSGAGAVQVHFMGPEREFGGVSLTDLAACVGLGECFRYDRRGTRAEARSLQESASVLVLYDTPSGVQIPMKFYDYAQMHARPLLIGWPNGALADAASRIGVRVHRPEDAQSILGFLSDAYQEWERGAPSPPVDADGLFAREHQSRRMLEALERLDRPADQVEQAMIPRPVG
jgi:hypothetical protein